MRGYNQAAMLAFVLSLQTGLTFLPSALVRTKNTRSQVGLSAEERRRNLEAAFSARSKQIAGRSVLLLDDVMTTGATLSNASQALLQAGASQVYALSLARALLEEHSTEAPQSPAPFGGQQVNVPHSS